MNRDNFNVAVFYCFWAFIPTSYKILVTDVYSYLFFTSGELCDYFNGKAVSTVLKNRQVSTSRGKTGGGGGMEQKLKSEMKWKIESEKMQKGVKYFFILNQN